MFSFTHLFHKDHNRDPNNVEASDERGLVDQGSTLDRCASVGVPVQASVCEASSSSAKLMRAYGSGKDIVNIEVRITHTHTRTCMLHS